MFASPTFAQPIITDASLPSRATIPQRIYFTGVAKDNAGLIKISITVSGPAGQKIIVYEKTLSSISVDLSAFYFDSGNQRYANMSGQYIVSLIITNSGNRSVSHSFDVTVVQDKTIEEIKERVKFEHLTQQDGLSSDIVYEIFQDSRGFMWFGTKNGLNRYDGYDFKHYFVNPDDSTSILGNYVWSIIEDHEGTLWVGTTRGLNKFDRWREHFSHFRHDERDSTSLSNSYVRVVYEDSKNRLWVGTINGLNLFNPKKETFDRYNMNPDNPRRNGPNYILSICEDRRGKIWVGTFQGLFVYDEVANKLTMPQQWQKSEFKDVGVPAIRPDMNGVLWIGTWGKGLLKRDASGEYFQCKGEPRLPEWLSVQSIVVKAAGVVWTATNAGVVKYSPQQNSFTQWKHDSNDPKSLHSNNVRVVYEDRAGTIWLGSIGGGISQMKNRRFRTLLKDAPNPASGAISAINKVNDKIWIGTWGGGLYEFDAREMSKSRRITTYPTDYVQTIVVDKFNTAWVGGAYKRGGLNQYLAQNDKFKRYLRQSDRPTMATEDSYMLADGDVTSLLADRSGNLWIGTGVGGLHKYIISEDKFVRYQYDPSDTTSLSSNAILALLEDHNGFLWVGTASGLDKCDVSTMRFFHYKAKIGNPNSLSDEGVIDLHEYPEGTLWIGTASGGLNRLDTESETFKHYRKKDGWPSDLVFGITHDSDDNLWVASDRGLVKFNYKTERFRVYGVADGLPSDHMFGPSFRDEDGRLFFGTNNGVVYFHPDSLKDNTYIPPVVLTDFKIFNKNVSLDTVISEKKNIDLSYEQNVYSFEFAALNYIAPQKNQYAYKMEGFDQDWIYAGTRRFASYTNLSPGDYTFRVKASNNDGIWNEEGTAVRITIKPPWWQTRWAYAGYTLLILGLLYGFRQFELNRTQARNELKMQRFEADKLREVDQMKSRFFANISHEFRTPLTLIQGPLEQMIQKASKSKTQQTLKMMLRNTRRLLKLIKQLLALSKLEAGKMKLQTQEVNLNHLVKRIIAAFESAANLKSINLKFQNSEQTISAFIDVEKFEMILTNLLSNALKFTPDEGAICVTLVQRQDQAEVSVSDTGIGIAHENIDKIFDMFFQVDSSQTREKNGTGIGLALARELIELHGGELEVQSEPRKGSQFIVRLPLGIDHLKEDKILEDSPTVEGVGTELEEAVEGVVSSGDEPRKVDSTAATLPAILLVEDNADMRVFLRSSLQNSYRIFEAKDGEEGFDKASKQPPDLIVSDVMMPKMDGIALCEKLKTDERTSHIPVIILTAKASQESKIEGLETGADAYLAKPFNEKELKVRVKGLIEQRRKLRERFRKEFLLEPKELTVTSMDEQLLQRAMTIVEENLTETRFDVTIFSRKIGMSRQHLNRKLRSLTDCSARDFIRTVRLKRAAQLLEKNKATVTEIAYEVGFNNPAYFAECFRKLFGKNPSTFAQPKK